MFQIPWKMYSESEILEVLTAIFRDKGYEVYNIHKTDRRGEQGVDIECTKPAENEKVLLAVKKKPEKSDIGQLEDFAERASASRIYVYIEEPSTAFKNVMEKLKNRTSFWNAETLTYELFRTNLSFYLFMILENSFEKPIYEIIHSFFDVFFRVEKKRVERPSKATPKMLNLLWAAKDRSSSLHKSLRTLQLLFEEMSLHEISEKTEKSMTIAFLKSIKNLKHENLEQLQSLFSEFLDKYPANFEQFCKQTKGRSNWRCWASIKPQLSPGFITATLESSRELTQEEMKELIDKHDALDLKPPSLNETFSDIVRILANEVSMFEDTVDDLFSIGLYGRWNDMREEFARISNKRTKELRNGIKMELIAIKEEIEQSLKNGLFKNGVFPHEVFANYVGELKQHFSLDDFLLLQKTYSKIVALRNQGDSAGVNRRRYEEAKTFVNKAIKMFDKKDPFAVIACDEEL